MTVRNYGAGGVYNLTYDAENRLTAVRDEVTADFVYDGDGNRVKKTMYGVTIAYIGNYFEYNTDTGSMIKYYYAGSSRVAMRQGWGSGTTGLLWLFGDHLSSTSRVANVDGTPYANGEQR
jgi:YD repeat-containing protein